VTLTLTSDDLESHIVVNVSSTLTNSTIWCAAALCLIVDVRTDGRTDGRTFLPGLLGHLGGDDLKTEWWGAGVVICLKRGGDLHMAQLIPLSLASRYCYG